MTADDVPRLAAIQAQPGVASAWGEPELEQLAGKAAGTDECTGFAVELEGEVVGLVEYHEEDDPMYRHAGIDIFLSEDVQGQGLGTETVRMMAEYLIRRARPPPARHRPSRAQHGSDPRLREGGLQSRSA